MPWSMIGKDPRAWIEGLEEGVTLKDPSKMRLGELHNLHDSWVEQQQRGKQPLLFITNGEDGAEGQKRVERKRGRDDDLEESILNDPEDAAEEHDRVKRKRGGEDDDVVEHMDDCSFTAGTAECGEGPSHRSNLEDGVVDQRRDEGSGLGEGPSHRSNLEEGVIDERTNEGSGIASRSMPLKGSMMRRRRQGDVRPQTRSQQHKTRQGTLFHS